MTELWVWSGQCGPDMYDLLFSLLYFCYMISRFPVFLLFLKKYTTQGNSMAITDWCCKSKFSYKLKFLIIKNIPEKEIGPKNEHKFFQFPSLYQGYMWDVV